MRKKILVVVPLLTISIAVMLFLKFGFGGEARFVVTNTLSRISSGEINEMKAVDDVGNTKVLLSEFLEYDNVSIDDSLLLVNEEYALPENYEANTVYLEERNVNVNECLEESFTSLSEEIKNRYGETLFISSAFRTKEDQIRIKNEKGDIAQKVGCSEHQTGLAVDVFVQYYSGDGFIRSDTGKFVNEKCGDYGFIIRYPVFAKRKTGISFEPWHLRYVGYPHSKIINESYVSLEEYINHLDYGVYYSYDEYLIVRQNTNKIYIPESFKSAIASFDNTGAVIITFNI